MPMPVQISGDRGLVWAVEDILKLRKEYRLVGCMVGGISRYQSQVAVMGLPLQLSPEEVSLAAAAGWIELYGLNFSIPTGATAAAAAEAAEVEAPEAAAGQQQEQPQQQEQQQPQQQQQQEEQHDPMLCDDDPAEFDEFYAAYYGLEAPKQQQQQQQQQQLQQQQAWQLVLKSNRVAVPMTIADTAGGLDGAIAAAVEQQANGQQQQQQQQQQDAVVAAAVPPLLSSPYCQLQPAAWQHPHSLEQWLRLAVFSDLHSKGFCVTGGAKFGGDFLAYPGDPHLYHAQYVVRVVIPDQVLVPSVLQGLARGVHAARKHLVLATVQAAQSAAAGGGRGGGGSQLESKGAAAAAAVGGLSVTRGVGVGGAGTYGFASSSSSEVTAAAAAVAAAATEAACQVLSGGAEGRTGPVQLGGATAAAGGGVLRYITVARETGWGGD